MIITAAGSASQPPETSPPMRFTVFSPRPIENLFFNPSPESKPVKLEFYPTARSPRYEYRGTQPLTFVGLGGETVATAAIPRGMTNVLLLFLPNAEPESAGFPPHRIAVIDDSEARYGAGGLVIINLSGLALSGMINRDHVWLKAGLNPRIAVGSEARVMLRAEWKGRSYQAYSNAIHPGSTGRALLILFPPFYRGSLEVQSRLLQDEP